MDVDNFFFLGNAESIVLTLMIGKIINYVQFESN